MGEDKKCKSFARRWGVCLDRWVFVRLLLALNAKRVGGKDGWALAFDGMETRKAEGGRW